MIFCYTLMIEIQCLHQLIAADALAVRENIGHAGEIVRVPYAD